MECAHRALDVTAGDEARDLDRGRGEGDVDPAAVLPNAVRLEMLNALPAFDAFQDFTLLVGAIRR